MSAMDVPGQPAAGAVARAKAPAAAWISWIALAMMTTSSVASLRAAPTMAVYGLACLPLPLAGSSSCFRRRSSRPSSPRVGKAASTTG